MRRRDGGGSSTSLRRTASSHRRPNRRTSPPSTGFVGLTKVVALETARSPITCNAICPGWVLTPLVQKQIDDAAARGGISNDEAKSRLLAEKQPSLEFATPEQIGAAAVFLCSSAADQIRGTSISVDGGWTAQ